jgi:predicted secreted protein
MATAAIHAIGTLLKMGDGGSPETFTTIAEVLSIRGPSLSSDTIDVTNHDTSNGYREFIMGLQDGGEVTFSINYQPTAPTHNATSGLLKAYDAKTKKNWRLVFPDAGGTTWNFAGVVRTFSVNAPIDAQLTADVTIKVSGKPTLV